MNEVDLRTAIMDHISKLSAEEQKRLWNQGPVEPEHLRRLYEKLQPGALDKVACASLQAAAPAFASAEERPELTPAEVRRWHGSRGDARWPPPRCIARSDKECRGRGSLKANEYMDDPVTLRAKIELLASMVEESREMAVYAGAGLSTA